MELFPLRELKKDQEIIMIVRVKDKNSIGDAVFTVKKDESLFNTTYDTIYGELNENGFIEIKD